MIGNLISVSRSLAGESYEAQLEDLILQIVLDAQLSRGSELGHIVYVTILGKDPTESLLHGLREIKVLAENGSGYEPSRGLHFVVTKLDPVSLVEVAVAIEVRCNGMCGFSYSYTWKLTKTGWKINSPTRIKVH